MNKRNTEGYVLAYLLIVIAVMGAIAATLMTSTVQVMASQQNSIQYMKDKYEAMGEVEKLVAELESSLTQKSIYSDTCENSADEARTAVKTALESLTKDAKSVNFNLPVRSEDEIQAGLDNAVYWYHEGICEFTFTFTKNSVSVLANYNMPYIVEISTADQTEEDPNDPDKTIVVDTDYPYLVKINSLKLHSYEISISEATSEEEGGDTE